MNIIINTEQLQDVCLRFAKYDFITVDTEFLRDSTFWPKLCLIQIACQGEEVLIDPLSPEIDLAPFFELMQAPNVVKVFHAARQDVEIIYYLSHKVPQNLFDTQIAAMVCGFGDSVSYGQLVKKVARKDLDKSSRFTDWSKRPLTKKQLNYALADVTYLRDIYLFLKQELSVSGRKDWLSEEMSILTDPETYIQRPENAWKRLKMRVKTRKALAVMMHVAEWREATAQRQNTPRSRVLKDEAIYDISSQAPTSVKELECLRTVSESFARSSKGKEIIEAVKAGLEKPLETVPEIKKNKPLPPQTAAITELLRVLLKAASSRHDVATKLIATSDDLEKIALYDHANVPALTGWRYELFGADAIALKNGKLSLAIKDGSIVTQSS